MPLGRRNYQLLTGCSPLHLVRVLPHPERPSRTEPPQALGLSKPQRAALGMGGSLQGLHQLQGPSGFLSATCVILGPSKLGQVGAGLTVLSPASRWTLHTGEAARNTSSVLLGSEGQVYSDFE